MADKTAIEWTDATWNPVVGCQIVSAGCRDCYAMKQAHDLENRFGSPKYSGLTKVVNGHPVWTGDIRVHWESIDQPLTWRKPRRIFVNSMSDLFHENIPGDELAQIYGVMIAAHHVRGHTFQVLTKRPDHMRAVLRDTDFWDFANATASHEVMQRVDPLDRRRDDARATCDDYGPDHPPPGIWLGVSVEDQATAMTRIPILLNTPAALRFISAEPLLGPVNLTRLHTPGSTWTDALSGREHHGPGILTGFPRLDWVIAGGESGPTARPAKADWFRSLRDQCAAASVPFFFKQWGEWLPEDDAYDRELKCIEDGPPPEGMYRVGKRLAGRLLDGVTHDGFPS
jgi:protein gp37